MISHSLPPSLVWLETSNFAVPSHSLRRFSVTLDLVVMSFISFTAEEIANAPKLEPALEGLLLSANVKQQMIYAFRVQTSINLMVALDSTEEGVMATCKQAFGIDTKSEEFAHKRGMGKAQHGVEASEDHMRHQRPCGRREKGTRRTCVFPDS